MLRALLGESPSALRITLSPSPGVWTLYEGMLAVCEDVYAESVFDLTPPPVVAQVSARDAAA